MELLSMRDRILNLLQSYPSGLKPQEMFRLLGLATMSQSDEMRKTLSEMELSSTIYRIFIYENVYIWKVK